MLDQLGPRGTKEFHDAKAKLDKWLNTPPPEVIARRVGQPRVAGRRPPAWFAEADAAAVAFRAALPTPPED